MYTVVLFTETGRYEYTSDSFPDFESAKVCRVGWLMAAGVNRESMGCSEAKR
jgi:hypothetical protein